MEEWVGTLWRLIFLFQEGNYIYDLHNTVKLQNKTNTKNKMMDSIDLGKYDHTPIHHSRGIAANKSIIFLQRNIDKERRNKIKFKGEIVRCHE